LIEKGIAQTVMNQRIADKGEPLPGNATGCR